MVVEHLRKLRRFRIRKQIWMLLIFDDHQEKRAKYEQDKTTKIICHFDLLVLIIITKLHSFSIIDEFTQKFFAKRKNLIMIDEDIPITPYQSKSVILINFQSEFLLIDDVSSHLENLPVSLHDILFGMKILVTGNECNVFSSL